MMIYLIVFSLVSVVYGVWSMLRPVKIARANKEFIDSGEETYFEQRRSWAAYGTTPPTEPAEIARRGQKEIAFGILGLILAAVFYAIDQGA